MLDGSVRWARGDDGSRVRITPQLIRTGDDTQIWAESYDRVLQDVFELQSEIATEVVTQLGVTLLEPEREEARPTESLEAYQAYLRGNFGQNSSDFSESTRRRIIEDFQAAVELDSGFAEAWAALAHAQAFYYRLGYDFTDSRLEMAGQAFKQALTLDSESAVVLLHAGYYHYYAEQDYEAALEKFLAASEAKPDDANIVAASAYVWRRQGKLAEGIERLERAFELSPRDDQIPALIGEFAMMIRDFPKAVESFDAAIAAAPDAYWPYLQKAQTIWLWTGNLDEPRTILESMPRSGGLATLTFILLSELSRLERDYDEILAIQEEATLESYDHQYAAVPKSLVIAEALELAGDSEGARAEYEVSRGYLETVLAERPDDYRLFASLGMTLAGLGRQEEAVAAGRKALEMMPIEKDVYIGHQLLLDLAVSYARLGMVEEALEALDRLLSIPAKFSVRLLEIDPRWDGLRDHPRYREIVEKYS